MDRRAYCPVDVGVCCSIGDQIRLNGPYQVLQATMIQEIGLPSIGRMQFPKTRKPTDQLPPKLPVIAKQQDSLHGLASSGWEQVVLRKAMQIPTVPIVPHLIGKESELRFIDLAQPKRDFLGAAIDQSLSLLDRLSKLRGLHQCLRHAPRLRLSSTLET